MASKTTVDAEQAALRGKALSPAVRGPAVLLLTLLLCVSLPVIGLVTTGHWKTVYLEFPPRTQYVQHAAHSVTVFACYLLVFLVLTGLLAMLLWFYAQRKSLHSSRSIPVWGKLAMLALVLSWALAWTRWPWFASLQQHTFLLLWINYIIVINALLVRFTGTCPLFDRPIRYMMLFPASAVFWWCFEWLNRYVQNWNYHPVSQFNAWEYFWLATLSFSTVLPAVYTTSELVGQWVKAPKVIPPKPPYAGVNCLTLLGCTIFLGILPLFPDYLFPLVWIAPLFILNALLRISGIDTILSRSLRGDPVPLIRWSSAALLCGLLWEMWNYRSYAHWDYHIPYVQGWHVFEMPLPGYAGYLPFGLLCGLVVQTLLKNTANEQSLS